MNQWFWVPCKGRINTPNKCSFSRVESRTLVRFADHEQRHGKVQKEDPRSKAPPSSSNKKLLVTSATLLGTSALLVVTRSY